MKRRAFLQAIPTLAALPLVANKFFSPLPSHATTTHRGFGCNQATNNAVNPLVSTGQVGTLLRVSFGSHLWSSEFLYANNTKWIPNVSFIEEGAEHAYIAEHIALAIQHPHYDGLVMIGNEEYLKGKTVNGEWVQNPPEVFLSQILEKQALWLSVDPDAKFAIDAGGIFPTNNQSISNPDSYWQRLWDIIPRGTHRQSIAFVSLHCYPNPFKKLRGYFQSESTWLAINQPRLGIIVSEIGCPDDMDEPKYNPGNVHQQAVEAGIYAWQWYGQIEDGITTHYRCLLNRDGTKTEYGNKFAAL